MQETSGKNLLCKEQWIITVREPGLLRNSIHRFLYETKIPLYPDLLIQIQGAFISDFISLWGLQESARRQSSDLP